MKRFFLLLVIGVLGTSSLLAQKNKNKKNTKEEIPVSNSSSKSVAKEEEVSEKPQMKVQLGHTGYISYYTVSDNGRFVATVSAEDKVCKLWDISTARELLTFEKDTNVVMEIHFSPDGKYLLETVGDRDKITRILEVQTGKEKADIVISPGMYSWTQVITGTTLVVHMNRNPNDKDKIFITNFQNNAEIRRFTMPAEIRMYKISPDGKYLAALSANDLMLWETGTGKQLQKISFTNMVTRNYINEREVKQVPSFTSDNRYLYFQQDAEFKRVNLTTNSIEAIPEGIKANEAMIVSPDGKYLTSSLYSETNVSVYSLADGKLLRQVPKQLSVRDLSVVSEDGNYLVQNYDYKETRVYDLKSPGNNFTSIPFRDVTRVPGTNYLIAKKDSIFSFSSLYLLDALSGRILREFKSYVKGVSFSRFSPDGRYAIWVQDSVRLVFWDLYAGAMFKSFQAHTNPISCLSFSNNGKWIATSGMDKSVKIWDIETGKLIRSMSVYTKWISSVVFSPDDKYLAAQSEELTFKIWETATGKEFKKYKGHTERVSCIAFTPDSKYVVSGAWDKTIRVWNIQTSLTLRTITGFEHPVNSIAFNANGTLLAAGGGDKRFGTFTYYGENKIRIWDFATGAVKTTIAGPDDGSVIQLKFSDDNNYILSRTDVYDRIPGWEIVELNSKYIQRMDLWRISDGKNIRRFSGNFQDAAKLFPRPGIFIHTDDQNTIHLLDLATGTDKKKLSGHTGQISNLTVSSDGKYLISRSNDDGFIKMWSMDSQEEQLNYIVLGGKNNDYLIYSPDNYYMSSKGGAKAVHFLRNFKVYEFEQFDLQYNRPDKVMGRLAGISQELIDSYSKAYKKRLKKLDFSEEMFSKELHLPVVRLTTKTIPLTTKAKTLNLSVSVSDSKYLLDRINVYVNDVPVYGMKGIELKTKKVKQLEQPINLTLTNGTNKIRISCMNEKGVESLSEYLEIFCDAPAVKPTLYLITVGVSKYKDSKMDLQFASKDAGDLSELFKQNSSRYASVQQFSFVNEKATRENILAVKTKLMMGKPDDVVMLMVSSHGLLDSELDYYIATNDVDFTNPSGRGLSYEALESILDGIPQRKKILFMDACHSGEVDKEEVQITQNTPTEDAGNLMFRSFPGTSIKKIGLENSFELMKGMFADLRRGSGATVISSAGGAEYAIEGTEWNNGVFTYCLINGLRDMKADLNNDGQVRLSEIEEYLQKKVPELTHGRQQPTSRAENLSNDFVVW